MFISCSPLPISPMPPKNSITLSILERWRKPAFAKPHKSIWCALESWEKVREWAKAALQTLRSRKTSVDYVTIVRQTWGADEWMSTEVPDMAQMIDCETQRWFGSSPNWSKPAVMGLLQWLRDNEGQRSLQYFKHTFLKHMMTIKMYSRIKFLLSKWIVLN